VLRVLLSIPVAMVLALVVVVVAIGFGVAAILGAALEALWE
jgi:hypothetical protein